MRDVREEWIKLRDRLKDELRPLLAAEGLRSGQYSSDFVSGPVDVALDKAGRFGWENMVVKVKPSYSLHRRPSIYRMKVIDATPEAVADIIQKAVSKARELRLEYAAKETRREAAEVEAVNNERRVDKFMREQFPEFKKVYSGTFESEGDIGVRLTVRTEGEGFSFRLKVDECVSAQEAREISDFLTKLEAARM